VVAIRLTRELKGRGREAETDIVVAVGRRVVVAVRGTAVARFVVPATAADDAVRALTMIDLAPAGAHKHTCFFRKKNWGCAPKPLYPP
jgi:hypothetical protein